MASSMRVVQAYFAANRLPPGLAPGAPGAAPAPTVAAHHPLRASRPDAPGASSAQTRDRAAARRPASPPAPSAHVHAATVQRAVQPATSTAHRAGATTHLRLPAALAGPRSPGRPLAPAVQAAMEDLFGTSFADVRIHLGPEAGNLGALAFTSGSGVYVAPNRYHPETPHGRRLLAHELTHVLQQRTHRVRNPFGDAVALVHDPALEAEAEAMGLRAAALRPARHSTAPAARATGPAVQRRAQTGGHVLQRSQKETSALIDEYTNQVWDITPVMKNAESGFKSKGWAETGANLFTKATTGATFQAQVDDEMGSGRVRGTYNDGSPTVYQESYMTFTYGDVRGQISQDYVQSYPRGQGVGYLVSYVGARWAKNQGFKKVSVSMINQNSAPMARRLNENTSTCKCCFLTTACAVARGLPEDCEELQVLRRFRDEYMLAAPGTGSLVDVYYRLAPRIVDAIDARDDAREVYESLYGAIRTCVDLIRGGDHGAALRLYRVSVESLAARFLGVEVDLGAGAGASPEQPPFAAAPASDPAVAAV